MKYVSINSGLLSFMVSQIEDYYYFDNFSSRFNLIFTFIAHFSRLKQKNSSIDHFNQRARIFNQFHIKLI